jgi:hypothetical protein
LRWPLNFTARREARVYRRTAVERVALQLMLFGPESAEEHTVIAVERVIDAKYVPRPADLVRGIPQIAGCVQSIATGVIVRYRITLQKFQHLRIAADPERIISVNVVCPNAIQL